MAINIRFITEADAPACNQFHNRLFGEERSLDQWRWGFVRPARHLTQIPFVVAEDQGRIIGTQAFIPIPMIDDAGPYWTAKSEETLVDPEYRGMKLFEKMYALLFDYLKTNELHSIWGFTAATKAFTRLEFVVPGTTAQLFFPFSGRSIQQALKGQSGGNRPGNLNQTKMMLLQAGGSLAGLLASTKLAFRGKTECPAGMTLRTLDTPPEDAAGLCRSFISKWGGTTILRDGDYLRWRLFDNPFIRPTMRAAYRDNRLVGWSAYCLGDDSIGYLVDLMAIGDHDEARETSAILIADATRACRRMGALALRGWTVNSHPFDRLVADVSRTLGYFQVRRGYTAVLYLNPASPRRDRMANFDSWYVNRLFTEGVSG